MTADGQLVSNYLFKCKLLDFHLKAFVLKTMSLDLNVACRTFVVTDDNKLSLNFCYFFVWLPSHLQTILTSISFLFNNNIYLLLNLILSNRDQIKFSLIKSFVCPGKPCHIRVVSWIIVTSLASFSRKFKITNTFLNKHFLSNKNNNISLGFGRKNRFCHDILNKDYCALSHDLFFFNILWQ